MTRQITIEHVGPIDRLMIPLPQAGVVVLRGRNGVGKSHALAAIDSLISGRGRPPCQDGARAGVVDGFGARLTIGRSVRRTGEAEVVTLEGRLDISQLVQPPIKDEEAADRQRIKALIQLSGQPADLQTFKAILPAGVAMGELVSPSDVSRDDPVTLAGKIKRALEAEARRYETLAETARSKAAAVLDWLQSHGGGRDVPERTESERVLQDALVRLREIQTRREEYQRRQEQIAKARDLIAHFRGQLPKDQTVDGLAAEAAELDEQIGKLQRALDVARERRQQIRRQIETIATIENHIRQLEATLGDVPEPVSDEELRAAEEAVDRARALHAAAVQGEEIITQRRRYEELRAQADEAEQQASLLRNAAWGTDEVLSGLVSHVTKRLRVENGRLVTDTDRGVEPFAELSPGERWRIALEIAAEQVGQGGLVTVPQEAWEALDPINRNEIARIAEAVGVVIITAEADEQDHIEAEVV